MSGHSHWHSIKHKKELKDAKRGKIFSKLSRLISVVVRQGTNPEENPKLRQVLEEAKKFNMPKENIERAIKKGTGEIEGEKFEEITWEAFGPYGIALIIEGITDNKNRTLTEIKQILQKGGGKLAEPNAIKWMFKRKGVITLIPKEDKEQLEILAIEIGAENFQWHNKSFEIYTKVEELEKIKNLLEEKNFEIESVSLDWVAKEKISLEEEKKQVFQRFFETLDENEAVQNIFSNLKI